MASGEASRDEKRATALADVGQSSCSNLSTLFFAMDLHVSSVMCYSNVVSVADLFLDAKMTVDLESPP